MESESDLLVEVAAREWWAELEIEHFLERSPEPLDDGDRARLADGTESLARFEIAELLSERFSGELRSLVGDEVSGLPEPVGGGLDEIGDLDTRRFFGEDSECKREAGVNVENDDELEDPDPEKTGHVGDIGHPEVIGFIRANGERLHGFVLERWFGNGGERRRILPVSAHRLAADFGSGADEHLRDGFAAADLHRIEKSDELSGDVAQRANRRRRLEKRADGFPVRGG